MTKKKYLPSLHIGLRNLGRPKLYTLRLTGDYNDHYDLDEQDVLPLIEPAERLILDASKAAIENIEQR